ncbi:MAG: response regulator [Fibrobacterales bacterium]
MKHAILIVDDEPGILKSLQRVFLDEPYTVDTCDRGEQALKMVRSNKYSIIISDVNMPQMNGIDFLSLARESSPDSIRIILSAYSDLTTVLDAINRGNVWRYITKPWDNTELLITVKNAIELYEVTAERNKLILDLKELNSSLEYKVTERTHEIESINSIQSMLLQGESSASILPLIHSELQRIFPDTTIAVHNRSTNQWYPNSKEEFKTEKYMQEYYQKSMPIISKNEAIVPLSFIDSTLGALLITHLKEMSFDQTLPHYKALCSTLSLALSLEDLSKDSSSLIHAIDDIIGNM